MKRFFTCITLFHLFIQQFHAQVSITTLGTTTEAFTSFTGTTAPTNWTVSGGGTTWRGTNQSGGTSGGWYGNDNISYLGSGTAAISNITWVLQNNTAGAITGFTLDIDARLWKSGTNSPTGTISWSNATTSTNPIGNALINNLTSLGFSDITSNISTGITLTQAVGSINIPKNDFIFIRFTHSGGSNSDNLGIDNVKFKVDAVLGVDFKFLNVSKSNANSVLSWQTATEKNNAQFQVERSQSGENFSKIGEMKGKGNSNVEQNYAFTDASPLNGINYYRLRQVDFDGTESVSKTVSVDFDSKIQNKTKAFPSPTHDVLNVELSGEGKSEISVRDMTGRIVLTQNTEGVPFTTLNLATLSNGLYIMSVRSNETTETVKIQKF